MPDSFPNDLPDARDPAKPSLVFCGAGMSAGAIPGAAGLYRDIHEQAEASLGITGKITHSRYTIHQEDVRLYYWAEDVLAILEGNGLKLPKLRLAEAMGLLSDNRWYHNTTVNLRGTAPRHRIIARFAKEGLCQSIWSFNWDCHLENAFEEVGLPSNPPSFETPWRKSFYGTHVHEANSPANPHPSAINIHKPHGCVRSITAAQATESHDEGLAEKISNRFMITMSELKHRDNKHPGHSQDEVFFDKLRDETQGRLNLFCGWSAGEDSLKSQLNARYKLKKNTLAVMDLDWSAGHEELACELGTSKKNALFQVEQENCPNRDDFFLWQQALYTLDRLEHENGGQSIEDKDGANWRSTLTACPADDFFLSWCDDFLPTWVRLCWSSGQVKARRFPSHRVDIDKRDEHIPLSYDDIDRPDLMAAVRILHELSSNNPGFNATDYPGGLYHEASRSLVIPIPLWQEINHLRALRPLIDSLRNRLSFVESVLLWTLVPPIANAPSQQMISNARDMLASAMPIPAFAQADRIRVINTLTEF